MKSSFDSIDETLKNLPKPKLPIERKENMHEFIMAYYDHNHENRKRNFFMKKLQIVVAGVAALCILILISGTFINHQRSIHSAKKTISNHHSTWHILSPKVFTKGQIVGLNYEKNKLVSIQLKVDTNFFLTKGSKNYGSTPHQNITLKLAKPLSKQKVPFAKGTDIIASNAKYTVNYTNTPMDDKTAFIGTDNIYYLRNGKYFFTDGKAASVTMGKTANLNNGKLIYSDLASQDVTMDTGFQKFYQNGQTVSLGNNISFRMIKSGNGNGEIDQSTNNGRTWSKQGTIALSNVMGISFINSHTGFLVENHSNHVQSPVLQVTHDSGKRWTKQSLPVPTSFKNGYNRTAQYPIFFNASLGILPVFGFTKSETQTRFLYMLITEDGGKSWKAITDTTQENSYKGIQWGVQWNFVSVFYKKASLKIIG